METDRPDLKQQFIAERGYWTRSWDQLLTEDPEFFEAYLGFSALPARRAALDPKTRELIYIAIDLSVTHLFAAGARIHIRNALALGATKREILDVLELVSVLGIHSVAVGLPVLLDEVERQQAAGTSPADDTPASAE